MISKEVSNLFNCCFLLICKFPLSFFTKSSSPNLPHQICSPSLLLIMGLQVHYKQTSIQQSWHLHFWENPNIHLMHFLKSCFYTCSFTTWPILENLKKQQVWSSNIIIQWPCWIFLFTITKSYYCNLKAKVCRK